MSGAWEQEQAMADPREPPFDTEATDEDGLSEFEKMSQGAVLVPPSLPST